MSVVKSVRLNERELKATEALFYKLGVTDFSQMTKLALGITSFLSKHASEDGIVTIVDDSAGGEINVKLFDVPKPSEPKKSLKSKRKDNIPA